jgi:hypothetical protein
MKPTIPSNVATLATNNSYFIISRHFLRFLGIYFVILGNFFKLTSVTDQVSEAGPAEPYDQ